MWHRGELVPISHDENYKKKNFWNLIEGFLCHSSWSLHHLEPLLTVYVAQGGKTSFAGGICAACMSGVLQRGAAPLAWHSAQMVLQGVARGRTAGGDSHLAINGAQMRFDGQ